METQVQRFFWDNISLTVSNNGETKTLLDSVTGSLESGEVLAIMGPSGSGKTTLLNILAQRGIPSNGNLTGKVHTDSFEVNSSNIRLFSGYVEQEDRLIGSLTVRQTLDFACRFSDLIAENASDKNEFNENKISFKSNSSTRSERIDEVLNYLGLKDQKDVPVGTPLQKGISGGQKRRLSVGVQLISRPSVLFLDEPTSGLDSTASHQIIYNLKRAAKLLNIIVIISMHQPSNSTFELLDKVLFLSKGKTIYNDYISNLYPYFEKIGFPIPNHCNPPEFILEFINTDFNIQDVEGDMVTDTISSNHEIDHDRTHRDSVELSEFDTIESVSIVEKLNQRWRQEEITLYSTNPNVNENNIKKTVVGRACTSVINCAKLQFNQTYILSQRLFIKSYKDFLAYYVRVLMYTALAILMGTVWLRFSNDQKYIQSYINAIFFSGAFMSFMSVAYIPAYLEDYYTYINDHLNGFYSPSAFVISNFIIGVPFIVLISSIFSIISYFMVNFRLSASGFWYYFLWLTLDLLAAESMTIFISTAFPYFVVALALTAFMNGLWMSVGGFLVTTNILNVFWYYTFYWINYQRYVFQGMMFNQFTADSTYTCGSSCHCMYSSPLESQCMLTGESVLINNGYKNEDKGLWIGVLIAIIAFYRIATYLILKFLRK